MPGRRARQHTPVFLPGESLGQKSLAGYIYGVARVGLDRATKHTWLLKRNHRCSLHDLIITYKVSVKWKIEKLGSRTVTGFS